MTDEQLKRLRDLARQATPGPWRVEHRGYGEQEVASVNVLEIVPPSSVELAHWIIDADYIAAASPDVVLALLQEVERLRAENAELRRAIDGAEVGGVTKYIKPPRAADCEWRSGPPPEIGWWPADGTAAGGPYPQILRYWNGHYFSDAVHHTDDARTAGQFGRIKHPCAYEILWTDRWWLK